MSETIRQSDLRNNNAEIMRRVAEGESFTITVHGLAVADLVPHQRHGAPRRLVPSEDVDAMFATLGPLPDVEAWLQELAQAEEFFDGDRPSDPWERRGR